MFKSTSGISKKIKDAFDGTDVVSLLVETQYGEARISKKGNSFKAEIFETGVSVTANDPLAALAKLGPWLRAKRGDYSGYQRAA